MENIENFKIIGIKTETSNDEGRAAEDLGNLWGRFYSENISSQITNKLSDEVYSIYTDYESNFKGKYTCIIGLKVDSIDTIPKGMMGREFEGDKYKKYTAKGEMPKAVQDTWQEIWKNDEVLNRKYSADFEVYGGKSQNGVNSEVEIFIAVE